MGKFIIKETKTGVVFNLVAANGETIATSQVYADRENCMKGVESVRVNAAAAGTEDLTVENGPTCTNPKFEIFTDKGGETRFHLKARNGQIVAVSQAYKEKAGAEKGIESVRKNAPDAVVEDEKAE